MMIINLFAEPSAGKSTTAAGLFFLMKQAGWSVELVTEYAKHLVWEERLSTLGDQLYVTATQNHRLEILRGKVDYAITDSPLLLGLVYKRLTQYPAFELLVRQVFDSYTNLNFLLSRSPERKYKQAGRTQNEQEAAKVAQEVRKILQNEKFEELVADRYAPEKIFQRITEYLNGPLAQEQRRLPQK